MSYVSNTTNTLKQQLMSLKDKTTPKEKRNVVYRVNCNNIEMLYQWNR